MSVVKTRDVVFLLVSSYYQLAQTDRFSEHFVTKLGFLITIARFLSCKPPLIIVSGYFGFID